MNSDSHNFKLSDYFVPIFLAFIFWSIAVILWQKSGRIFYLINFGYIGTALSLGISIYVTLPAKYRWLGRRFAQLQLTSRFSLLKVEGNFEECTNCGICSKICPMDIKVNEYIQRGVRVNSTECILCSECVEACPNKVLDISCKLDMPLKTVELLRERNK